MSTPAASSTVATRILGIDPGLRNTGFGVIDTLGSQLRYVASGVIRSGEGSLPVRLKVILDGVRQVITTYQPDQVAIEIVFVNVNPQSTLLLGQARGAAIVAGGEESLEIAEYTATQIKQAVAGTGGANKEQVMMMVMSMLIFMMMVVGGGVLPLIQGAVADITASYMASYWVIVAALAFILWYALAGCKNVNKEIPTE